MVDYLLTIGIKALDSIKESSGQVIFNLISLFGKFILISSQLTEELLFSRLDVLLQKFMDS